MSEKHEDAREVFLAESRWRSDFRAAYSAAAAWTPVAGRPLAWGAGTVGPDPAPVAEVPESALRVVPEPRSRSWEQLGEQLRVNVRALMEQPRDGSQHATLYRGPSVAPAAGRPFVERGNGRRSRRRVWHGLYVHAERSAERMAFARDCAVVSERRRRRDDAQQRARSAAFRLRTASAPTSARSEAPATPEVPAPAPARPDVSRFAGVVGRVGNID